MSLFRPTAVALAVHLRVTLALASARRRLNHEAGQTSAEYALVLLGAAGVALLVGAWAGGTDRVTRLLNAIFDGVIDTVRE